MPLPPKKNGRSVVFAETLSVVVAESEASEESEYEVEGDEENEQMSGLEPEAEDDATVVTDESDNESVEEMQTEPGKAMEPYQFDESEERERAHETDDRQRSHAQ